MADFPKIRSPDWDYGNVKFQVEHFALSYAEFGWDWLRYV